MDRTRLAQIVDLNRMDLHSVDSLMRSVKTHDSFKIESLFLKAVSSPSPSEDQFENVPCVLIQSTASPHHAALLYLQGDTEVILDDPPWIRAVARGGLIVLGISLPKGEPLARAVAKILKGVSYLDLRREIVDRGEIVIWGRGKVGVWGLIAAVLDDRVKGVVVEDLPLELTVDDGNSIETTVICGLLPPKKLLILGYRRLGEGLKRIVNAYRQAGRRESVRFEEELGTHSVTSLMKWVQGGLNL